MLVEVVADGVQQREARFVLRCHGEVSGLEFSEADGRTSDGRLKSLLALGKRQESELARREGTDCVDYTMCVVSKSAGS